MKTTSFLQNHISLKNRIIVSDEATWLVNSNAFPTTDLDEDL